MPTKDMKIETLRKYFQREGRTKLYVTTPEFLLAGHAFNPREEGDSLLLDVGPYVVYSFGRREIIRSQNDFMGLRLDQGSRMTRKFRTHRSHVGNVGYFADYLRLAKEL